MRAVAALVMKMLGLTHLFKGAYGEGRLLPTQFTPSKLLAWGMAYAVILRHHDDNVTGTYMYSPYTVYYWCKVLAL